MIRLKRDIQPLTDFKRKTAKFAKDLKKTGAHLILTVNGKARLVVMDARAYEKLIEQLDELDTLNAIREGLQDADKGRGRPWREAFAEIFEHHRASKSA